MAEHLESGKLGEQKALAHIKTLGYEIICINWRHKSLEIDIIARDQGILTFVEVKSRKSFALSDPDFFVDEKKQGKLIRAAEAYLEESGYEGEVRFDVVAVYLTKPERIEVIKDAFWSN